MTTAEVSGEGLGLINGLGYRQHGRRRWQRQGWQSCWQRVGIGDGGDQQKRGRRGTEAANSSKVVGVWDSSGKSFICGSSEVWDGRSNRDGNTLVLVIIGKHGRQQRGQKRGARWRQRGCRLRVATTRAAARSLESESAAAISVSEGVVFGEGSGRGRWCQGQRQRERRHQGRQRRFCYVTCVVSSREGVGSVWYTAAMEAAAARASAAFGLQRRWRP